MRKPTTKAKKLLFILSISLLVIGGACAVYVNDYYHAGETAVAALNSNEAVTVEQIEKDVIAFIPKEISAGLIFYPGGKVEYTAYAPLLQSLAENGILCILPHMTCNLAVLEMNAADGLCEYYPEVKNWYLGGHSLGGSMAASYLEKHTDNFDGLFLFASYSTANLSSFDLDVLSVYGTKDFVLNAEKYEKYKENLPADFTEHIIQGGCHAYFGNYGTQDGDGTPTITEEEQIAETVNAVLEIVK